MDLEAERAKGCTGKKRLTRVQAANRALRLPGTEPYECRFCGHWHLTANPGGEHRRAGKKKRSRFDKGKVKLRSKYNKRPRGRRP